MADKPIAAPLPADLPENWQAGQIVAPTGEEVNLSHQHGYNYLMEMVNKAQRGVNAVNDAFESVSGKRTCRFVVGTSTAGWTEADCDFLCDGTDDRGKIFAAISFLPDNGGEIVILSGTYNLTGNITIENTSGKNISLIGEPGSTVLSGSNLSFLSFRGKNGDFSVSIDGITFSSGGVIAQNVSLFVTRCRFLNATISLDLDQEERRCSFLCNGNYFDWSPTSDEQGIVLMSRVIFSEINSNAAYGCIIVNNVFKINSVGYSFYGSIYMTAVGSDNLANFSNNVILSAVKTSVSFYCGAAINGNYIHNCDISCREGAAVVGNRITNGRIITDVMPRGSEPVTISVSGNIIKNGGITAYGGGAIVGNAVTTDPSDTSSAAILVVKGASNSLVNHQPAIVGNSLWGSQYGIFLKNPPSNFNNKSTAYALVNSNRIYGTAAPIRIESEWSSCMVTDNVFETGAITDLGTNNIVRFNSDDSSTGGSSGGGTVAGVTRFNGRQGAVLPQSGDYTAAMMGAIPASQVQAVQALTQAEYDALGTKSASTLYLIKE